MDATAVAASGVKLLGVWGSPFSRRVELALKLKGVPYEFVEEDLSNKSALLLKSNPIHKKIPVLIHHGKPICESLLIIEYIDETWKHSPILPSDPYDRSVARFWAKFIDEKCVPTLFKALTSRDEACLAEAREVLRVFEKEVEGKKFFRGNEVGLVDIAANFMAFWVGVLQEAKGVQLMTPQEFPGLCKWADQYVSYGVFKDCLPPREKLLAFFKTRFGGST